MVWRKLSQNKLWISWISFNPDLENRRIWLVGIRKNFRVFMYAIYLHKFQGRMPNPPCSFDVNRYGTSVNDGQVNVTRRTLRTIVHSIMVHARVLGVYIHFSFMYTTDNNFQVLRIKDLITKESNPTTPFKLATGTRPSISHLRVLFCPCVVWKATAHIKKRR